MTPYQLHKAKWKDGCGSCLCDKVKRRCFFRGVIPSPVLFVGEAPGSSENDLGEPFVGPAGQLLDSIIAGARELTWSWPFAATNLVLCFPVEQKMDGINEPPPDAIRACRLRLVEFVRLCRPRLIVTVGKLTQKWVPSQAECSEYKNYADPRFACLPWLDNARQLLQFAEIIHPAAILKGPVQQRGLLVQRSVAHIVEGIESLGDVSY